MRPFVHWFLGKRLVLLHDCTGFWVFVFGNGRACCLMRITSVGAVVATGVMPRFGTQSNAAAVGWLCCKSLYFSHHPQVSP
jgi:hypothetical protein